MLSPKPLDVVILQKYQDGGEAHWERYEERGEKMKQSNDGWSCYILATDGELFAVRCTNTTKKPLAVQISVDACYIQQYLLCPKGEAGDTAICYGTTSHSMAFGLVSALTRAVGKLSRPPSETGCINVMAYHPSGPGNGLPPPEKSLERLDLPVNMDGTFWKLCVKLVGGDLVLGEPSPHAAEINKLGWKRFAIMSFNYRTADELFSGRVRGVAPKRALSPDTSTSPAGKRKRKSMGDTPYPRGRFLSTFDTFRGTHTPVMFNSPSPSVSRKREGSTDTVWVVPKHTQVRYRPSLPSKVPRFSETPPLPASKPKSEEDVMMLDTSDYEETDPQSELFVSGSPQVVSDIAPDDSLQKPTNQPSTESPPTRSVERVTEVANPVVDPTETPPPPSPPPQPRSQVSMVAPTVTPPTVTPPTVTPPTITPIKTPPTKIPPTKIPPAKTPPSIIPPTKAPPSIIPPIKAPPTITLPTITPPATPHTNSERENSAAATFNGVNHADPALTTFLDKVSTFRTLGITSKDLQEAGISTLMELKVIARNPEAFREKIPLLAILCERDQYLWVMFRWELRKLLEGEHKGQSMGDETDPVRRFAFSMGGGECIDVEELVNGLRRVGVSSENDLLVLSRNLERYRKHIPFLREFAISNKFGWTIFQVGLEGLPGQKVPSPSLAQDRGADREGHAYVKWFLDTIDPEKPLGHLVDKFVKAGLTDRTSFLHIAEVIDIATEAMPLFRGLAAGDQLVWAMILVGFENLLKSA